jgi:ABC-type hemin transport system substrate-binding protein
MQNTNAEKLQSVIGDDLFPQVHHISDVKQVLEEMKDNAQDLREPQLKALILLEQMGKNQYLHGDKNPYKKLIEFIMTGKKLVADPQYYIDTIEALIPKPPKPIIMAEKTERGRK